MLEAPSPASGEPGFDTHEFRRVLGHFATGVVALTGRCPDRGTPLGIAVNSFTSVSLDPPLVGFCVGRSSSSWPALRRSAGVALSILGAHQEDVCRSLAASGPGKFAGITTVDSPRGNPLVKDALAWIEADIDAEHPAGDHLIVVARVRRLELGESPGHGPLTFYRGAYGYLR